MHETITSMGFDKFETNKKKKAKKEKKLCRNFVGNLCRDRHWPLSHQCCYVDFRSGNAQKKKKKKKRL